MRVRGLRGAGLPVLGSISSELGDGLSAIVGGDGRGLRTFQDALLWAAGFRETLQGGRARPRSGVQEPAVDLHLELDGEVMLLKAGGQPGPAFDAERRRLVTSVGMLPGDLALAWGGEGAQGSSDLLREASRVVAGVPGFLLLEATLERLASEAPELVAKDERSSLVDEERQLQRLRYEAELNDLQSQIHALEDAPERLTELEEELGQLRLDSAETGGDLEADTAEWLRERQDAETHLLAYRDRARELRDRLHLMGKAGPDSPCPTCGRELGDHYHEVMEELQDEWESIVQDGRWWRRRWEQLDPKPVDLRERGEFVLRLHSEIEECAERVERCRAEVRELDELRERQRQVENLVSAWQRGGTAAPADDSDEADADADTRKGRAALFAAMTELRDELLDAARRDLMVRAGGYLNEISGGRLLGMGVGEEGRLMLLDGGTRVGPVSEEERAIAILSLRLALAELVAERTKGRMDSLLVGYPINRLGEESLLRFADVLRELLARVPQILLFTRRHQVELVPEAFDSILELRGDDSGGSTTLRPLPAGVGVLRVVGS